MISQPEQDTVDDDLYLPPVEQGVSEVPETVLPAPGSNAPVVQVEPEPEVQVEPEPEVDPNDLQSVREELRRRNENGPD